ncbi:MAG: mitochondrial large ribosomal subunit protein uL15m, partial [Oscillatoriales cyanobacterium SM2_1_8]|nr:mitochondrial large ribosomal subunit protein uL15m [Oscillatoriales cyanobacterium SM2_1_8]
TVKAAAFTQSARQKIEGAGGTCTLVDKYGTVVAETAN